MDWDQLLTVSANNLGQNLHVPQASAKLELTQNCCHPSTELPAPSCSGPSSPSSGLRPVPCLVSSIPTKATSPHMALISVVRVEFTSLSPVPVNGGFPTGSKSPGAESPCCQQAAMPLLQREPAQAGGTAVHSPNLQENLKKSPSLQAPPHSPRCCSLPTLQTQPGSERSRAGATGSPGGSKVQPSPGAREDRRGERRRRL